MDLPVLQPELDFAGRSGPDGRIGPDVQPGDIAEMERILGEAKDWVRAKDFPGAWSERMLRAAASESEGRIISGQRGYKLTRLATAEEVARAAAWLRHQGKTMLKRAVEIELCREAVQPAEDMAR